MIPFYISKYYSELQCQFRREWGQSIRKRFWKKVGDKRISTLVSSVAYLVILYVLFLSPSYTQSSQRGVFIMPKIQEISVGRRQFSGKRSISVRSDQNTLPVGLKFARFHFDKPVRWRDFTYLGSWRKDSLSSAKVCYRNPLCGMSTGEKSNISLYVALGLHSHWALSGYSPPE